jgi:diaminopimelate decarboxylase
LGAGAEVISEHELWLALRLGVAAEKIVYNGPAKSDESIETAINSEILSLNINHLEEMERIKKIARRLQKPVNVSLRIAFHSGWTGQLGIPENMAIPAYRSALSTDVFDVVGFHCHRGVAIRTGNDLAAHLGQVLRLLGTLKDELKFSPAILNLGGSLGIPTVRPLSSSEQRLAMRFFVDYTPPNPEETLSPKEYAHQVIKTVVDHFQGRGEAIPRILIEPGRALTGNSQLLLCKVVTTRADDFFTYGILDAGTSIADYLRSEFHQIFPLMDENASRKLYRLAGPICHTGDTIRFACRLPELADGDALAIMDSGAYFVPEGKSFSFPQPGIVALDSTGSDFLLRSRETHDHLIELDQFEK